MAAFGRMRLDVDNCLQELVDFGVVRRIVSGAQVALRRAPPRAARTQPAARHLPRAQRRRQHRRPVAVGAALPRNDRAGREDARRLRVDPHRSQVGYLGPDPGPDRVGQGSRGADDPRAESPRTGELPGGELRGAPRHAVRIGDLRLREGRVHRRARPQAGPRRAGRIAARCSSTRSATCRSWRRRSCCACSRTAASSGSAGSKSVHVDFRLISATNRPLDQFVRDARFREDLYYRVNAFAIRLPSLRERPVDIPVLANRFVARYCAANGLPARRQDVLARGASHGCCSYPWPGNIRELESTVSRAALTSPGRVIRDTDIEFLHPHTEAQATRVTADADTSPKPNARTSPACSKPWAGTRRKPPACSGSAAGRCTERSSSTTSIQAPARPGPEQKTRSDADKPRVSECAVATHGGPFSL